MGAPTASLEVQMPAAPRETACAGASPRNPVMVTVAGRETERRLMVCHAAGSGVQECAAANWGVSAGGSFVSATQSGSILPARDASAPNIHVSAGPTLWTLLGSPSQKRSEAAF